MINKIKIDMEAREIVFFKSGGAISVFEYTQKRHNTLKKLKGYYVSANLIGETAFVLRTA